jgi:hypothetical protein
MMNWNAKRMLEYQIGLAKALFDIAFAPAQLLSTLGTSLTRISCGAPS